MTGEDAPPVDGPDRRTSGADRERPDRAERVRRHLLEEHRDFLADVVAAGGAVDEPDRDALRASLAAAGLLQRATDVLRDAVAASGGALAYDPVPAPPYVVVASDGLVLRATLSGTRLVITVRTFDRRGDEWVRAGPDPSAALTAELR